MVINDKKANERRRRVYEAAEAYTSALLNLDEELMAKAKKDGFDLTDRANITVSGATYLLGQTRWILEVAKAGTTDVELESSVVGKMREALAHIREKWKSSKN